MKTKVLVATTALALFALVTISAPSLHGQAVFGSIFGTVSDPSGAAVSNASVTVIDQRKGTEDHTTTNDSGNYSVTHLIPDVYTVKIEAPGFKIIEQKDITVNADASSRVDGQFVVGSTTESVEVTGEAPQLKTDRADVATEFNQTYVEDLPILNRNFTTLELLSPGSQKLVGWSHAATENPQASQQIYVQGQHFSGTAYELDGTDNQDPILGIIVVNPNLDSVGETKITLDDYDAEFGKAIAGVVTAQTKSGSNDIHGSAFYFRRTDATQARDPFTQFAPNPVTGRFIPSSRWQEFGGSIGGPIIKNKLFFFGDYQGWRQSVGNTDLLTTPTSTVLSTCNPATNTTGFCDLSQYLSSQVSGGGQVYDPTTGNTLTGAGRTAFASNHIPIAMISPQAAKILALFPQPTNGNLINNYIVSGSGPYTQNAFDVRIDYSATPTVQIFGRFSLQDYSLSGAGALGPLEGAVTSPGNGGGFGNGGLAGSSVIHNYSLASGVTKTFSSSLLADFRFGYFKYNPQTAKPDQGTSPMTSFGIPNANTGSVQTSGLGGFFLSGASTNGGAGAVISNFGDDLNITRCNCPLTESEQQFQFVTNWTKIHGNHQFKFGADIRYAMNLRVPSDQNRTGEYFFSPLTTSNNGVAGLDLATFLLGDVSQLNRYVNSTYNAAERQHRMFYYGEDSWRITPKLTLNYGLRWEVYFPEYVNGKGNGGFADLNQGLIRVAGYGGFGLNGNINNDWHYFAPRIGIAYQLTPKTVVRMGYGRSYDMGVFGSNFGHVVTQNLPVLVAQSVTASNSPFVNNANAVNQNVAAFTLAQGPPVFNFPAIPASGTFPLQGPNGTVSPKIRPTFQKLPTLDSWNATVQHQLNNTTTIEVAYIGNKGTHGFVGDAQTYNVNEFPVGPGTAVVTTAGQAPGFTPNVPANQRRPFYNAFTYPQYIVNGAPLTCCSNDLGTYYGNDGSASYNALSVKVEKRFSHGIQLLSFYTFSHANNYDNNYFADNPAYVHGPDDFNRDHVWITNLVYQLPFGKGKSFGGNASKPLNYVIGGWEISDTTNWSSGLPWTPQISECGLVTDATSDGPTCRPEKANGSFNMGAGSFNPQTHVVQFFTPVPALTYPTGELTAGVDTCSLSRPTAGPFALPACGTLGNWGRNAFFGPRQFLDDMSIAKNFALTERTNLQFRMDAFNVFNHPVYGFDSQEGNRCVDCGGTAGQITDIQNGTTMRELQFSLRLSF